MNDLRELLVAPFKLGSPGLPGVDGLEQPMFARHFVYEISAPPPVF